MKENLIIIHGGGPTAVLNCSLYGAVREAQASGLVEHVYGAVGGTGGLLNEKLLDFGSVPEEELERLPTTPATAIGTSRDALEAEDYARMADILAEKRIRYVLMNGGNGTMDACGKLAAVCRDRGISVMGIPKTMDNDIAVTDHCPGFGSVARYMAGTVRELGVDVRSLPIHVVVLEALGRNAGWTTAAAALAREQEGDAPHLLYPPERPFHEDEFLDRVGDMYRKLGGVVVVASEGLHDDEGKPIVDGVKKGMHLQIHVLRRCVLPSGAAGGAAAGHQGPQREAGHPGPGLHRLAVPGGCRRSRGGGPRGLPGGAGRGDGADGGLPPRVLRALPLRDLPGAH